MAVDTVLQQNAFADRTQLDGFVEILEGKTLRMPDAVLQLYGIFPHQVVRHMAIIAGSDGMMHRGVPTGELLAHDVAVGAGGRVVRKVGSATRIIKGIRTDAGK